MLETDKFSRWIFKTIYRNTHSRSYQHNKNLWPYFKVKRNEDGFIGDVFFKHNKIHNTALDTNDKTKPLIIMATGPSVSDIDCQFFDDSFDYLGVNGAFSMRSVQFNWYVIIDRDFVYKRISLIKEIVARDDITLFCTSNSLGAIFSNISIDDIHCHFKIFEAASGTDVNRFLQSTCPVNVTDSSYHWHNGFGFSDSIEKLLFDYGTVAYPALQIACLLGYKHIYIAGLDMNNFDAPRFYEVPQDKLSTRLDLDFENIYSAFNSAREYCSSHDIQVINLSPDSAIDAFPKVRWDDVIKQA